jgi:hypothetical protein
MSDDDQLPPDEAHAARLLAGLRESHVPRGRDLATEVTRHARWQRHVRHVLVSVGAAAGGIGDGLASLARGRR